MSWPFEITVHVYRRPHMRCDSLEYELYMGKTALENLFDREKIDLETTKLHFSFPERWLNIVEERSLYQRIAKYYPNVTDVTIKTQSVYIIQSTEAGSVFIVHGAEEQAGAKLPQESAEGRLWFSNTGNIVNANGLTVLNKGKL